ncbi:hypothetical protein CDN99_05690 [Roseateles aquatilis]|uniref:Uncharacterized protein n=1 Tax=Roseateles aquatilis TaxID=431061 RepID=A0A246JGY0_9BURK|nr:hypothetical protein CDN99_05690 [Roseateles aquatilis]
MRSFHPVQLFEVVVLATGLLLASAAGAQVIPVHDRDLPVYDPCRDGRNSYGRAMDCGELLRRMDREEERRRFEARYRPAYDPCKDGRYSTGRPMTCGELRERIDRRAWRERREWRRGEPFGDE